MGSRWVGIKTKKNLVLEQIVAKSNFLLQLPGDGFSLSFLPSFSPPQMAFQPSLEVKIRRRVRGPSQIFADISWFVFSSQFDSLNGEKKESALGFHHSAYCLGFELIPLCWLYFVLFSLYNIGLCAFTLACKCCTQRVSVLLDVGHFRDSVHKIKAVLMSSSCSNIDANFARLLCLQTVESLF